MSDSRVFEIPVEVKVLRFYRVSATTLSDAQTQSLEMAIREYPGMDVKLFTL